ncbi:hypothetical protein O6H91_10G038300 [Diphasiastrum complanatum]|uniref:Uncharacterized protein n=1 Tax=Diphasiastrum complanatum TaxID=34168 RepID=A0ACC2CGE7_DIPCM|nr:hypothetical protein O6H91_10G038300 [Diphasiastrum complanatum]
MEINAEVNNFAADNPTPNNVSGITSRSKTMVRKISRDYGVCCVLALLATVLSFVLAGALAERFSLNGGGVLFASAGGLAVLAFIIALAVDCTERFCTRT